MCSLIPAAMYVPSGPGQIALSIVNCNSAANINFSMVKASSSSGDTCGYPFSSGVARTSIVFNESEVLREFLPKLGGPAMPGAKVKLWYNDEHAMTLGVRQSANGTFPVSPLTSNPGFVINPQIGDPNALDPSGRPMFPALFITDITNDSNSRAGDWQYGGTAIPPSAVYGTWKAAVSNGSGVTPDVNPAKNNWNLGAGSDTPPLGLTNQGSAPKLFGM